MFKRLFSLICFLFICLVPVNLFALEDNYVIKSNGSVNSLYSKYIGSAVGWKEYIKVFSFSITEYSESIIKGFILTSFKDDTMALNNLSRIGITRLLSNLA